jgi:hypothetical protein
MKPELIVMLTFNDKTVADAIEVFDTCKAGSAKFWGFKEAGLPIEKMKALCSSMKDADKTTFLEVVEYTEEKCLAGAQMAVDCGFDILMGTMYFDSVLKLANKNGLKYMPFVGEITGRPSVLGGTIEGMINQANALKEKGVYGIDLLGYRFTGDAVELNKRFVDKVDLPVCLAGSISSYQRLDEVKDANPWSYTIGSAFFDNKFEGTFHEQIEKVLAYMDK